MISWSSLLDIDTKLTILNSLLVLVTPCHGLFNPNIDVLQTSCILYNLISELIILILCIGLLVPKERSLNTLDTFPIEIGLQYDRGKLLVNEDLDSAQASDLLFNFVIQTLELLLQRISNSLTDLVLAHQILLEKILNLIILQEVLKFLHISAQSLKILLGQIALKSVLNLLVEHLCSLALDVKSSQSSLNQLLHLILLNDTIDLAIDSLQLTLNLLKGRSVSLTGKSSFKLSELLNLSLEHSHACSEVSQF